ncbi:MAG: hypothetical protein LBJ00_10770 [Planctomycetaceae bacterium]|jgi:hypothetical protein|nr:hypothetical protein [Planctomycetaceae bacterium]
MMNCKKRTNKVGIVLMLLIAAIIVLGSCDNITGGTTNSDNSDNSGNFVADTIDPAFWFGEIHDELIIRIGVVRVDEDGTFLDGTNGINMGQIANCEYVCNAINAKWGLATVTLVSGTATQVANTEYLLKMIDKANANRGATNYGTSSYATKQIVDKVAVDDAVNRLWKPAGKFVAVDYNSNKAAYSTDGINWTAATLPGSSNWNGVTYGNGKFVAVSHNSNKAAYSTDGINWTAATLPGSDWWDVTYGGE